MLPKIFVTPYWRPFSLTYSYLIRQGKRSGSRVFLWLNHAPYPKETVYQRAKQFLGTSYMRAHGMRSSNQNLKFCMVIKLY